MTETRYFPVPDGLVGERVDAAIAKLTGMSRAVCADMCVDGLVRLDGRVMGKSDRLNPGGLLEVGMPKPKNQLEIVPVEVPGFGIVYQDA
ncbi:MAG: hypothetical protein RLZ88_245, partial [Actinomycetota bacterium]